MQLAEVCYVKQKAAWAYLFETRFREAGPLFFDGQTDPRLLLRLFPDIVGGMMQQATAGPDSTSRGSAGSAGPGQSVDIYRGLQAMLGEHTLQQTSIDGISASYLPSRPVSRCAQAETWLFR